MQCLPGADSVCLERFCGGAIPSSCQALHASQSKTIADMHVELHADKFGILKTHGYCLSSSRRCLFLTRRSTARRTFTISFCTSTFKIHHGRSRDRNEAASLNFIVPIVQHNVTGRGRSLQLKASADGLSTPQKSIPPTKAQAKESKPSKQR